MTFDIGPFRLYHSKKNSIWDVSLKCMDDWACGWEYGWRDPARGENSPIIEFRIGKLMVLYLSVKKDFLEWRIMGFWGMKSWKTKGGKK